MSNTELFIYILGWVSNKISIKRLKLQHNTLQNIYTKDISKGLCFTLCQTCQIETVRRLKLN